MVVVLANWLAVIILRAVRKNAVFMVTNVFLNQTKSLDVVGSQTESSEPWRDHS